MPATSRRGPRAVFMVGAVAILVAAIIAALGFNTTTTVPAGLPPTADLVTVTGAPVSRPVPPSFVGLSLEYTALQHFAGETPATVNPVFVQLLKALAPHAPPVLRIGGDTTDWGWFPVPGMHWPRGVRFALNDNWVALTRALAHQTQAKLILGLNLEAGRPRLVAQQVRHFSRLGARTVAAFEIGNEPEVFGAIQWYQTAPHHPVYSRPRSYGFRAYVREVSQYSKLVPRQYALAGPSTGGPRWWARTGLFLSAQSRVRIVTWHLYPLHECRVNPNGPYTPTIAHLLSPAASTGLAAQVAPYVSVAHRHGAQVRIDELNSVSCGGQPGVSDRFASALWAIDALFALAADGVDGVNFHTFSKAYYRPFWVTRVHGRWQASVAPMYYGMLAFDRAAPPGSRLLRVGVRSQSGLRVWATRGRDRRVRVMLLNTAAHRSRTIALKLPRRAARATLERLRAPGLTASTRVTLAGQTFGPVTTTGSITGRPRVAHLRPVRPGIYVLRLPAASAAILTV